MSDTATAPAPAPETAPASSVPGSEEAELLALAARDQPTFEYYRGPDGTEKTGAERLLALQNARKAEAEKAASQQTPPSATDDTTDADEIDLDLPAEVAEGETDEGSDEEDTGDLAEYADEVAPWAPPEGTEISPYAKAPLEALDKLVSDGEQRDAIIGLYDQVVAGQQAHHAALNKAAKAEGVAALKAEHGENFKSFMAEVKQALLGLPDDLREGLLSARLPDGRLIANLTSTIRAIHQLGTAPKQFSIRSEPQPRQQQEDRRIMQQQEQQELVELMHTDIDAYRREWRGSGKSGSERLLELRRELANEGPARPSQGETDAEERALLKLKRTDMQRFMFGDWNGTGRPAADRLVAIQSGRG